MISALMGPYGCGKTTMIIKTAPRRPVHIMDIDRKVSSMVEFKPFIDRGELTFWELTDTFNEDRLGGRMAALLESKKSDRPPRGWSNFATQCDKLDNDLVAKAAGTIVIDSYTVLALHMKTHMQFLSGKSKLVWDSWSAWAQMWKETTSILIDYAKQNDKDLIITLHERVSEKPGDQTKSVIIKRDEKGQQQKDYTGQMEIKIAGSIEGQFGLDFGALFTDVYGLKVEIENNQPKWVCRVHPDGRRDLRCSAKQQFNSTGQLISEFPPDYAKIFGVKR